MRKIQMMVSFGLISLVLICISGCEDSLFSGSDYEAIFYIEESIIVIFSIPGATRVQLSVVKSNGDQVAVLFDGQRSAGNHRVVWLPEGVGLGTYGVEIKTEHFNRINVFKLDSRGEVSTEVKNFADQHWDGSVYRDFEYNAASSFQGGDSTFQGSQVEWESFHWQKRLQYLPNWDATPRDTSDNFDDPDPEKYESFNEMDQSKYYLSRFTASFDSAMQICGEANWDIVCIGSSQENNIVSDAAQNDRLWIGLIYNPDTEQWHWMDGEQLNYTKWNTGEPDHPEPQCAFMYSENDSGVAGGRWGDTDYSESQESYRFVVETSRRPVLEAAIPSEFNLSLGSSEEVWQMLPLNRDDSRYWLLGVFPKQFGIGWDDATVDDSETLPWDGSSANLDHYRSLLGL